MITRVKPDESRRIDIFYEGDENVTEVCFENPDKDLKWVLNYFRRGDKRPYSVPLREEKDNLIWTVTLADTAKPGMGIAQLVGSGKDQTKHSGSYSVFVGKSLVNPGDVPAVDKAFLDKVAKEAAEAYTAAGEAKSAASAAGAAAGRAETALKALEDGIASGDFRGEKGEKGDKGDTGPQGPKGEAGPAGDTTAADAAAESAKEAAQEAQKAAEDCAGKVNELKDDIVNHENRIDLLENGGFELKEDFLASEISDWLDEHPEATTSVQDHSLTINKLVNGTLGYVTPEMFGAIGDGESDDTQALINCAWYCYTNKIPCNMTKKYGVKKQIQISFDCFMSKDSRIVALEQTKTNDGTETALVNIGAYHTCDANININVDCNNVQNIAVEVGLCRHCCINVHAYNFKDKGFYNKIDNGNNENIFNVWVYGASNIANYGVYNISGDSIYQNIITVDCKVGVYTKVSLTCDQIHSWLTSSNGFSDSKVLVVDNGWTRNICHINWFYQDGIETGLYTNVECAVNIDLFLFAKTVNGVSYESYNNIYLDSYANCNIIVSQVRCNDSLEYESNIPLKFYRKKNNASIIQVGLNVGSIKASGKYSDADNLPDVGCFCVPSISSPISVTNATFVCNSTIHSRYQLLMGNGELYIRFKELYSQTEWGVWRKVNTTIVS